MDINRLTQLLFVYYSRIAVDAVLLLWFYYVMAPFGLNRVYYKSVKKTLKHLFLGDVNNR